MIELRADWTRAAELGITAADIGFAVSALRRRGVSSAFALPPPGADRPPLRNPLARAAAAVFEDYPAPPFKRWARRIADTSPAPVIAVDASCIVPMQTIVRRYDRAFESTRGSPRSCWERFVAPGTSR
jgi:hypothetical protein